MNNKKVLALGLSALMLGSVLAGCGKSDSKPEAKAEAPKYTFRLAETHPADYPTTLGDKKFADLVAERSNGRIKINVFHSAQLGEEKSVIEQVQMGSIEFTRVSSSPLAEFNKAFGVFSLPYIFDSEAHEWKFLESDYAKQMLTNLEKSKFIGLAYYDSGSRSFYTKNKVTGPADLKGMKIRVQQNKINMDLIQALGASATPMPYGEVFSGLQTGVIDGAENNAPSYLTANHFQAVKYYVLDAHQRVPEVLMASKATWDKLSAEDRKLIQQAATDSIKFQREAWNKFDKEALDKLKTQGVTVTEVKDVKPWQAAVKPVIDKYNADFKTELEAIAKARN
ncbi:C4-dicarboxylate ABC transporter [Anaerosporomusa subterranea]|jgi:tripartite ATP-independent transporter DctP family solute receptor|uniref:C4-dicarboxylate ABC transporter n=1 Tax=Anaerosporomusa subterranea TaxID=1794912 RepID=A0A154BRN2_ANASB|nr:TRAP transporter substrate-binding protein [Anaerosporomusa subterranea]KYZ76591.1 C4-dicarboxylate ABC transporter [Anaerosporomusa subterranea]MDF2500283.1 C4-dicarboxylate transporter [Anaerosporomusa subterranea]